jgi:uncharacterized protein
MSHRGSLLLLPSGVYAWDVRRIEDVHPDTLAPAFAVKGEIGFLLLGTGRTMAFPPAGAREALADAGIGFEIMDTGAACRTYNILLAEQRQVAAALIAVE